MKKYFSILSLLIILINYLSYAQWTPADLGGGDITNLAVSGKNLYAGTFSHGIFLSTDDGIIWSSIYSNLPVDFYGNKYSELISAWGQYIFATYSDTLYRSTNNGSSWEKVYHTYSNYIHSMVFSDTCFLAGCDNGILRSKDNGVTWIQWSSNLKNISVHNLAVLGKDIYAGTLGSGIYHSTDDGINWTTLNNGLTNSNILCLVVSDSTLFAGTEGGGIFRSTNKGNSWETVDSGITGNYVTVYALAALGSNIFAGTEYGGIYRSSNNGDSWETVNTGLAFWGSSDYADYGIKALIVSGSNIFAGSGKSVFRSSNNGNTWISVNIGIWDCCITSMTVLDTTLFVLGNDIFRTTDNGLRWTPLYQDLPHPVWSIAAYKSNLFAVTYDSLSHLFSSADKGETWVEIYNSFGNNSPTTMAGYNDKLFAGTYGGVFLSTDNGASWTLVNIGLANSRVNAFAFSSGNVFAGTSAGVFLSTDNGQNWNEVSNGLSNKSIYSLAILGKNIFAGTYGGGVFRSTDNGTNWIAVNNGLYRNNIRALVVSDTNLFAGTEGGVFLSTNNGENWANISTGLKDLYISCLALCRTNLFAGSSNPVVWKLSLSQIVVSVKENPAKLLTDFKLKQNYPNPFNPTTKIEYSIPRTSFVTLKVYDILGREVATLVNEEKSTGNYNVIFDGNSLPSEIYFYKIQAGDYSSVKKMILVK